MASSSSAIYYNYDVFLSFRGEDTRYNFTSHLYEALRRNNIKVFIDYDIRKGKEITLAIERVIEGAKMSIIVFSKNYAESTFCLDELLKIMECRESNAQIVLPIFYKVEPLEEIYQDAFARHEQTIKQEMIVERLKSFFWKALNWATYWKPEMKVEKWKSAFRKALGLAGEPIDDKCNEAERIERITCEVLANLKELNCSLSKGEGLICTSLVGQTAENNFKKILECLMNDKISRVGVYGMGGVGKTTIATHINNQLLEDANSFTHIYWVTVSKDSTIYKLQSGIAKRINLDLSNEDDEKQRAAMIRKELNRKKFLLILDDVWEAYELTMDVGLPPLVGGQKILLTSRNHRVCERMECQLIEVKPLFDKEAINLFVKESRYPINNSLESKDIMRSIVKECAGLPLAIVVIARRMRGLKEIIKWRNTLRELQKPCEGENPEMEEKVFKVLKFSYDRLPNDMYRQCFLYCSLFPEDYKFKRDDLIEYLIGEGIIYGLDSRQAELDKGNCILDELIYTSLLEYGREYYGGLRFITMHDVIRDMACIYLQRVGSRFQDHLKSVQVMHQTALESFTNSLPYHPKLSTLILRGSLYGKMELPDFFANMQSLIILDVFGVELSLIPDSITSLGNLRVLIICDCRNLECIPYLGGLEKLRHLKISEIFLKEVPEGIERLVNLRVLDLSFNRCLGGSFPSGVFEKLSDLQTLDLSYTRVEVEPEELISLEKLETLSVHFQDLHRLNCYLKSGHWRRLVDYGINYGKYVIIDGKKGMFLEAIRDVEEWKGESCIFFPENIEYLKLKDCESPIFYVFRNRTFTDLERIEIYEYKSRVLFTVDLARQLLHNVQKLDIYGGNGLEKIIATEEEWVNESNNINYPTIVLPNLKILTLYNLQQLRSIYGGRMVCPSLEFIQIAYCDELERLPFCMKEDCNQQNPTIKLQNLTGKLSRRWWNSLQWDNPNAKSMYKYIENESDSEYSENESESEYSEYENESEIESP